MSDNSKRTALCLSGGGFRAALFHLGALRRLNELGILSKIDTITSVSGGSILAAHLATQVTPWPERELSLEQWQENIERPFLRFVQRNIRTAPILKRFLLPWNWFRPSTQVRALESCYRKHLTNLMLSELPKHPKFVFCATDMIHGVSWVFEKHRVGSYKAGYLKRDFPLAKAVAASSCFPPVFCPMPIKEWQDMSLSDGGLYDNLGLQPVERHDIILSSDGGQPFAASVPKGVHGRIKSYIAISGKQAGAIRKRLLISQFQDGIKQGTYWGVGSAVSRYRSDVEFGYSKEFAANIIASIRTDMDAFSEAEIAVLMNHGYLLVDIALGVHAPQLIGQTVERQVPYPEWLDEDRAKDALKDSGKIRWLGRY